MGSCQGTCTQNSKEYEITMEHKEKLKKGVNSINSTSQLIKTLDDTISEEMNSKTTALPPFVKKKYINQSVVVKRTNRFMNDLELEVKCQIRKIQQEEEENNRIEELKHRYEQKQMEQSEHSGLAQDPSFSFQNSMKRFDTVISNPYQPKQTSQFAPKKEGDTVSQKSQISKTVKSVKSVSPKSQTQSQNLDMVKKAALKRIQTMKDELISNNASRGSRNTKAQVDAFEKIFSEYCSQDHSSSKSKKSVKSILKHNRSVSSINISMSKYSVKSTRTIKKSKKVRFTGDTNFNNERKSQIQRRNWWDL